MENYHVTARNTVFAYDGSGKESAKTMDILKRISEKMVSTEENQMIFNRLSGNAAKNTSDVLKNQPEKNSNDQTGRSL